MSTFYGDIWKFSIIGDISPSGNIMPRPFDMQAYLRSIDGVSEWIASLPFDDDNYELSVDARASAHDITPIGNQYRLTSLIMATYNVKLRRIVGRVEEVFLATFYNGQKCDESYTAMYRDDYPVVVIKEKDKIEQFHDSLIGAMNSLTQEDAPDEEEEEDYYDQVWR